MHGVPPCGKMPLLHMAEIKIGLLFPSQKVLRNLFIQSLEANIKKNVGKYEKENLKANFVVTINHKPI